MPVVINEFEVIAETAAAPPPSQAGAVPEPAVVWATYDIEQIVRRQAERAARLRAD
jgi:hypothetical protein